MKTPFERTPWIIVTALVLTANIAVADTAALSAKDSVWPGWRGPSRDGIVQGDAWPLNLSSLEKSWQQDLGPSYSGPVVSREAVFVTETTDKKHERVRALDRNSGKELWATQWEGAMTVPFFAASNGSWIRSTPTYDGERLYVAGMRDVLACLDAESGKELWRVDFKKRFGTALPSFGFVCSPLVTSKHVYVQAGASFVKLDKLNGEAIWRSLADGGGMYGSAFSSPVLASLHEEAQLVVQTRAKLAGIKPDSGDVLWEQKVPAFRGMNILTPTLVGNRVFTSSYGGGSRMLEVSKGKEGFAAKELWGDTAQGYMSSPVVSDGHLYLHLRNQRLTCFELASGKRVWTSTERYGKYMSLVAQDNLVLALDERGVLYLFRATPEKDEKLETLDSKKVSDEPTWAHLAIIGEELFIRGLNRVSAWTWGRTKLISNTER